MTIPSAEQKTSAEVVSRLQARIKRPVRREGDTLWIGEWAVMKEFGKAIRDFRDLEEDPETILVGIILDALNERDPMALRRVPPKKSSPES